MRTKREATLIFRCTKKQHALLKRRAEVAGLSESEYIRRRLKESSPTPPPKYDWQKATEQINRIGSDINSLAVQGNSTGWIDPDAYGDATKEFDKLLSEIEGAVGQRRASYGR